MALVESGERRVVKFVRPVSAARMALALSATLGAILVVGLTSLWLLGKVSGALGGVESFMASWGFENFSLSLFGMLPVVILMSAVGACLAAAGAAALAVLYNLVADLVGGVEVSTREQ